MKKSNVNVSAQINVTPEQAWEIIGAVDGVNKWLAPIETCRVDGAKRYCSTEAGEFLEDIHKIDYLNKELHYAIPTQPVVPVENIVGVMKVRNGDGKAVIDWQWQFDVLEENESQAKEMLIGMGQMGIQGIESLILSK